MLAGRRRTSLEGGNRGKLRGGLSMHRNPLVDMGGVGRHVDGTIELAVAQRLDRIESGEQPTAVEHLALRPGYLPPDAQALQQHRREHGVPERTIFFRNQRQAETYVVIFSRRIGHG